MLKLYILCAALIAVTITVNGNLPDISPFDLLEEAEKQLTRLKESVRTALSQSITAINGRQSELLNHASEIQISGESRMHTKYMELVASLNTLKGLAETANVDITSCLKDDEPKLTNLPTLILNELELCTARYTQESDDNNKKIEESLNNNTQTVLDRLTTDLAACSSVLCITSVVNEIQTNEITLPQNIQVETDKAINLIDIVTLSVEQCLETEVADFVNQGDTLIEKIGNCIGALLG